MNKLLILFTMRGCPYCDEMKNKLNTFTYSYLVNENYKKIKI